MDSLFYVVTERMFVWCATTDFISDIFVDRFLMMFTFLDLGHDYV